MQTHEVHGRQKGPRTGWGVRLIIVLAALANMIFGTGTVQAKELSQAAPPNPITCGGITAAPITAPENDDLPPLNVQYHTTQPSVVGVVMNTDDGMAISFNGQVGKFTDEENAHSWSAQIAANEPVTITSSTGPDNSLFTYKANLAEYIKVEESLGDASVKAGVYEALAFELVAIGSEVQVCVLGGFNDPNNAANITYQLWRGNELLDQAQLDQSQHGVLDLVELKAVVAAEDELRVIVTTLENPGQAREEYYLVGLGLRGTKLTDQDGDGLPDPVDPQPTTPRACTVTGGFSPAPRRVGEQFQLDLQYTGQQCAGYTVIRTLPGALTKIEIAQGDNDSFVDAGTQCLDFSGDLGTEAICTTGDHQKIRITSTLSQAGTHTIFAVLGTNRNGFRYWASDLTVLDAPVVYTTQLYLPLIERAATPFAR